MALLMANAVMFLIKVRRVEPPGHRKDIRATERLHHAHITSAAPACLQQVHPLPLPLLFILMTIQCHPSQASLLTPSPPARPAPGYSMHRTPLQGLYLCGAGGSTHNPTHCFFSLLWRVCIALQLLLLLCNAHLCMCTPWWRSAGGRRPQLRFGRAERQGQEHAGLIASHAPLCATAASRQNYRLPQPLPSCASAVQNKIQTFSIFSHQAINLFVYFIFCNTSDNVLNCCALAPPSHHHTPRGKKLANRSH